MRSDEGHGKLEARTLNEAGENIDCKDGLTLKSTLARDSIHTLRSPWVGSLPSCYVIGYLAHRVRIL